MALPAKPLMDTEPVQSVERPKAALRELQAVHLEAEVGMDSLKQRHCHAIDCY